jgi:hypothetical protein
MWPMCGSSDAHAVMPGSLMRPGGPELGEESGWREECSIA